VSSLGAACAPRGSGFAEGERVPKFQAIRALLEVAEVGYFQALVVKGYLRLGRVKEGLVYGGRSFENQIVEVLVAISGSEYRPRRMGAGFAANRARLY